MGQVVDEVLGVLDADGEPQQGVGDAVALAGGGGQDVVGQLGLYAKHLGMAFQIIDDLLDDGEARAGKPPELSCLQLWSAEEARRQAADHTAAARVALRGLPGPVEPLVALAEKMLKRVM